ncbi:hypothetical protein RB595_009274 [Gaeumannomyces hyphopodioides]
MHLLRHSANLPYSVYTRLGTQQNWAAPCRPFLRLALQNPKHRQVWTITEWLSNILGSGFANMAGLKDPLVWIDCEMTGLDPESEDIIEIFCLITDGELNLADEEGWGAAVHLPKERMDQMGEWCTRTHAQTGLTERVLASDVTPEKAAEDLLAYIRKYVPEPGVAQLAGNSVHHDRAFLRRGPYARVVEHLHYRILDVSSIKEAARRWSPRIAKKAPSKKSVHTARADILESIREAKHYRDLLFIPAAAAMANNTKTKS